jgi:hypothetical protein
VRILIEILVDKIEVDCDGELLLVPAVAGFQPLAKFD